MPKSQSPKNTNLSTTHHKVVPDKSLTLASTSMPRITMLKNAGISFKIQPANINEDDEQKLRTHLPAKILALELSKLKALSISSDTGFIIGADQTLDHAGTTFHKPKNKNEALNQLKNLRGQTHTLTSAIAIAHENRIIWHHSEQARLTMRNFSDQFMLNYLEENQTKILTCPGCYQLENTGIHLFEKIEGDYFTILGMPLLPCLSFLRSLGLIPT